MAHPPPDAAAHPPAPDFWLILGDKLGDNAQALALAQATGWPYRIKQVFPRPEWVLGKPTFRPALEHLDLARSAPLEPPWPDLILTIGRRPSMAALWVQEQSGGRTRIVLIGRPKRWIDRFALVVVPSQFKVPPRPNVVGLGLPLMRADRAKVTAEAAAWCHRLAGLPRPLTAVLVGGATKPFRLDAGVAHDLLDRLGELQKRDGGTLYVTTSRRTQPAVVEALATGLPAGSQLFRWTPEAAENPYLALLGLADRVVVTGDSISMMVEAASLQKPLAIFPLPLNRTLSSRVRTALVGLSDGPIGRLVQGWGLAGYGRDLRAVHAHLCRRGLAVMLGEPIVPPTGSLEDELAPVVARLRALSPASHAPSAPHCR